jgi:hypothetical protein
MPGVVATVPPTEAREVIAACRAARGTAHASQSEGGEVDESALTIYIVSCEKLEELGYSVEERPAELEIMLLEDDSPYDGRPEKLLAASPRLTSTRTPRPGPGRRPGLQALGPTRLAASRRGL